MTDLQLPADWDLQRDLLILLGGGSAALARDLRARGQERLVVVAPRAVDGLPADVPQVSSPREILHPVVAMNGGAPTRFVVHQLPDPWADGARRDAAILATREAVRSRHAQRQTLDRNGATWARQGLANLRAVAANPSIAALKGSLAGRTAFVCAPGPSLSAAIPHLREHRGRSVVIAVSHALHALLDSGVTPDFVVVADAGNLERHFEGVDTRDVPALVGAVTCRSAIFDRPARQHFHFAGNGRADDWLYGVLGLDVRLPSGGSVSCSAASLAVHLGCERVVFCGLDLAFPGGRFYAAETLDGDATVEQEGGRFFLRKEAGASGSTYSLPDGGLRFSADQRSTRVRAVGGGEVSTSLPMRVYLSWFEATAHQLAGRVTLVQTSPDGAFVAGVEHESVEAEAARLAREPAGACEAVDAAIDAALRGHDPAATAARLSDYFRQVQDTLPLVEGLAHELGLLASRATHEPALLDRLQAGEQELRGVLGPLLVLSLVAHGDLQRAEQDARAATDLRGNLRAAHRIFNAVERACALVRAPLEVGLEELSALLEDGRTARTAA